MVLKAILEKNLNEIEELKKTITFEDAGEFASEVNYEQILKSILSKIKW